MRHGDFVATHPYGEEGSIDYWIEVMKRAYTLGEERAQAEIDKLLELRGPQPPRQWTEFPLWFGKLWLDHIAPYNNKRDHPQAMPY